MKNVLIIVFSVFLIISCGKVKKEDTTEKTIVESSKTTEKSANKTNVKVDADGVAHVVFTTNDMMKFNIKKFSVKAGQKVKLTLNHTGKLDKKVMGHNVVVLKKDVKLSAFGAKAAAAKDNDYIPEGTTEVLAHTKMIGGGETTTIEFTAPKAGSYDFICSFPAHFAMMKGKMIVE